MRAASRLFSIKISKKDLDKLVKKPLNHTDLERFVVEKYDRGEAKKTLTHLMYFDDVEEKAVTEYVKEVSQKALESGDDRVHELDEAEERKLQDILTKYKHQFKDAGELNTYLKTIYYNKRLLRVFLANLKVVNRTSLMTLYDLLEKNFSREKEAREQERDMWKSRRDHLQRINPKLDLRFRFEAMSRQQICQDDCYIKIKAFILNRISGKSATLNNTSELCCRILDFEKRLDQDFVAAVFGAIERFDPKSMLDKEMYLRAIISKTMNLLKKLVSYRVVSNSALYTKVMKIEDLIKKELDLTTLRAGDAFSIYINGQCL